MTISFVTQWCRQLASVGASALLLTALGSMPAQAVLLDGFFALDSNTADTNAGSAPDDWESFISGGTPNTSKATGIVDDSNPPKVFRNGSKDTQDISAWRYDLGSSPPKDDMLHAYAAAYKATAESVARTSPATSAVDDLLIYFGADRAAFQGTASLGFWFFKNPIDTLNGSFVVAGTSTPATHTDGDTLVAFEYTNGGAVTDVRIFQWINGVLTPRVPLIALGATAASGVHCDPLDQVCGATNTGNLALPWNGTVKAGQFFEAGINITKLVGGDGCYSSFMATSRSSSVEGAALKNFILSPGCTDQRDRL